MANTYHLQKFLARCELFIMQRYHTNPSSRAFIPALSSESQLRIYRQGATLFRPQVESSAGIAAASLFCMSQPQVESSADIAAASPFCMSREGKFRCCATKDLCCPRIAALSSGQAFVPRRLHGTLASCLLLVRAALVRCRGCAEAKPMCTAVCQSCGRMLQQGKSFHISKALASCGKDGCTGCVKARAVMTGFPSEETVESWQNAKQLAPAAVAQAAAHPAALGSPAAPAAPEPPQEPVAP